MDNKGKRKLGFIITALYLLVCLAPYFIDGLNSITPKLFGVPFTVWSILVVVVLYCIFLFYMSKNVWYHYDDEEQES
jgi:hypothetical protein